MTTRVHARLPVDQRVKVSFANREALFELYLKDISRGGVFVGTDAHFDLRQQIEIVIEVEDAGALVLLGEVVHLVTPDQARLWGGEPGVGVQFADLVGSKQDLLESYLDGIRDRLDDELKAAPFNAEIVEQVEKAAGTGDLFGVLGVNATADSIMVQIATETRSEVMSALLSREGLNEALRKRIEQARVAVQRAGATLSDDARRAQYLFQTKAVEPHALGTMFSDSPAALQALSKMWNDAFPEQAQVAERLAQLAKQAAGIKDYQSALKSAQLALQQHPFILELHRLIAEWEAANTKR